MSKSLPLNTTIACCATAFLILFTSPLRAQVSLSCIPEVNVSLDANGLELLNPEDFLQEAPPPEANLEISPSTVSCRDLEGMGASSFTVTDLNNGDSCFGILNVKDRFPPTALCLPNVDVQLDEEGLGSLDPGDIDDGSLDNCSPAPTFSLDRSEFTCDDVGPQVVQMDVIDDFGNQGSSQVTVNVMESAACSGGDCVKNPNRAGYWLKQCLGLASNEGGLGRRLYRKHHHKKMAEENFATELIETVGGRLDDLFGQAGLSACQDGMKVDSKYDSCDRAFQQLTALLFNIESGRLTEICPVCLGKSRIGAATIGEFVTEIAELIKAGECKGALKAASKVNKRRGLDCD